MYFKIVCIKSEALASTREPSRQLKSSKKGIHEM